jgi:hypothetical protein
MVVKHVADGWVGGTHERHSEAESQSAGRNGNALTLVYRQRHGANHEQTTHKPDDNVPLRVILRQLSYADGDCDRHLHTRADQRNDSTLALAFDTSTLRRDRNSAVPANTCCTR